MATTVPRSQMPLGWKLLGDNGRMEQRWARWLQQFTDGLPPAGAGYVIDGTASTNPTTMFQGPDANKGSSPAPYSIYFAPDSGQIYTVVGGTYVSQLPAFTGDVTKPVHSTVLTLPNINPASGTFGDGSTIPVITTNAKGQIINVTTVPVAVSGLSPSGPDYSVQFNLGGVFANAPGFVYVPTQSRLYTTNLSIDGSIGFTNPQVTLNNLFATSVKGDIKTYNGTNVVSLPVGTDGQVLTADSTAADGLSWQTPEPHEIPFAFGDVIPKLLFMCPPNKVIYSVEIIMKVAFDDVTSTLQVGDTTTVDSLMAADQNAPYIASTFSTSPRVFYGTSTQIELTINAGTSTQGSGLLVINVQR